MQFLSGTVYASLIEPILYDLLPMYDHFIQKLAPFVLQRRIRPRTLRSRRPCYTYYLVNNFCDSSRNPISTFIFASINNSF